MTDKIKALHAEAVQKGICVTNYSSFKAGYLAAQKEASEHDKGPWVPGESEIDGRVYVQSEDFTHDVRLYINGDFGSKDERLAYAENLAKTLNRNEAERQKDAALIEQLYADLRNQNFWVEGALKCKDWIWDGDQRESAESCLASAISTVEAVEEWRKGK